ncbi:hypothetical protein D3C87_988400 [compost metagenome]
MILHGVGIDSAYANTGFAHVSIDLTMPPGPAAIKCLGLRVVSTAPEDKKIVRRSSDHLRRAREIFAAMAKECEGARFAFVEVPSGAQDANAAFGFGVAVGVLASCPASVIEVNPMEVKAAVLGFRSRKGATKAEVIEWAVKHWPSAPWLRAPHKATIAPHKDKKTGKVREGYTLPAGRLLDENEHTADALAAVVAGISTPAFKQLIALHAHAIPLPRDVGPAPRRTLLR